jgi:hypothetical protein
MPQPTIYKHSGRAPLPGVLIGLVGGALAGVILAFAYAYAIAYIPVVGYITFVLAAGFGAGAGAITGWLLKRGKVRSTGIALLVVGLTSVVAFWASWVAWTYAVLSRGGAEVGLGDLATRPSLLWQAVQVINEVGAWSFRGSTPKGTILWVFWGVEALLILVPALLAGAAVASSGVFCERCQAWCPSAETTRLGAGIPGDQVRAHLAQGDLSILAALGPHGGGPYTKVELTVCPRCSQTATLAVDQVVPTTNSKGETSEETVVLAPAFLLSPAEIAAVRALGQQQQQAQIPGITVG